MTQASRILFAGDVHGRFDRLEAVARDHQAHAVVLLGDIEAPEPMEAFVRRMQAQGVQAWFIHGNHDTDTVANWERLDSARQYNLHGRVVEVCGVRIAGLGGIFRGAVWHPHLDKGRPRHDSMRDMHRDMRYRHFATTDARRRATFVHQSTIFPDVVRRLAALEADVLVTHEAPSCHRFGFEEIDALARALRVKAAFHGHHHDAIDYREHFGRLGFTAYGVGLRGITDLNGISVLEGELDRQRGNGWLR